MILIIGLACLGMLVGLGVGVFVYSRKFERNIQGEVVRCAAMCLFTHWIAHDNPILVGAAQ